MTTLSRTLAVLLALAAPSALAQGKFMKAAAAGKPLWATLQTNHGDVVLALFSKDAPKTVENFVGLAAGEKEFTDPASGKKAKRPYYDGVTFHRCIENFMIQGGDPTGTGRGGPGYAFEDEFQSKRGFSKEGLLAMANAGPSTNGSQFFITTSLPNYLDNKHTIFGEVVTGYDVVLKISRVAKGPGDRPIEPVVMKKVVISDKAPAAAGAKK